MIRATKTIVRFVNAFLISDEAAIEAIWLEVTERPKLAERLRRIEADLVDQIEAGADIWK
jgi:hypothetical protein